MRWKVCDWMSCGWVVSWVRDLSECVDRNGNGDGGGWTDSCGEVGL